MQRNIIEPDKLPLFLCFLSFVVTFLTTRAITRLIRAGKGPFRDMTPGGLHIHHSVPGLILLLLGAGFAVGSPPTTPWREIAAVAIGTGASLVLDEFALILHLDDVYWSQEGQLSVQAVALVTASLACLLVGFTPFGVNDVNDAELSVRIWGIGGILLTILAVVVCGLKGKYRLAVVSIFIPQVAMVGAIRLARPGSPWARRRYRNRPRQLERATARAERFDDRWDPILRRIGDVVAGSPSAPDPVPRAVTASPRAPDAVPER